MGVLDDWGEAGFDRPPVASPAPEGLLLYRVWGGTSEEFGNPSSRGSCFCVEKPSSRFEAESLFNIAIHGNALIYVSTYAIDPGTIIHVGGVAPPSRYSDGVFSPYAKGVQVFVERASILQHLHKLATEVLPGTVLGGHVYPGGSGNA